MKVKVTAILTHASRYLDSARLNIEAGPNQYSVALDDARHSVELSGKALLLKQTGEYYKTHRIAGPLAQHGLIPRQIEPTDLNRLLDHHTRAAYGFLDEVTRYEAAQAHETAEVMLEAATNWPQGRFRPPFEEDVDDLGL